MHSMIDLPLKLSRRKFDVFINLTGHFFFLLTVWHKWHWFHCLVWRWCLDGSVANNRRCGCNWFYPIGVYHLMFMWTFSQTQSQLFQMLMLFIIVAQFPKLLEVVGLAYTVWFTSRYLLFKVLISLCLIDTCILVVPRLIKFVNMQQSRDELATKIDELKEQIFGSEDNWCNICVATSWLYSNSYFWFSWGNVILVCPALSLHSICSLQSVLVEN